MSTYIQAQMSDCDLLFRPMPAAWADAAGGGEMTAANRESAGPGSPRAAVRQRGGHAVP